MAISTPSFFVASPSFAFNSNPPSNSVKFKRLQISAAYATAEKTVKSFCNSNSNTSPSSLYEVLGVRVGADTREVKAAYRRLARVLHPDVANGESSAEEFMRVHSAYSTLADPAKRADYDRSLLQSRLGGSSAGGYKSRRWETDQCW